MRLVLDTNVAIDWFVFADPATKRLKEAVVARRVRVLTHECAMQEFRRALGYRSVKLEERRQAQAFEEYCACTSVADLAWPLSLADLRLPANFPRCRDRDDQYFLALAHHARADALASRDKKVLQLRGRVRRFGLTIVELRALEGYLATLEP